MHSVVIHLKKKPQEWHLVESLFYKVQASKQLLFLEFNEQQNWDQVYKQVQSYILLNRFEHWQLIIVNNNELNDENMNSLTREIQLIKEHLLRRLGEKGISPSRRILLTFDGLKRKADYSPEIAKNHYQWQMDNFGYIHEKCSETENFGNAFLEDEILAIDLQWGHTINLKDAGIMDEPSEKFMEELANRNTKVKTSLENLILTKKEYLKQNQLIKDNRFYELHSEKILDTIYEEFCLQLDEMCMAPFSYHLNTFLPSTLLKTILQENIGISSVIGDFLLIRKAISECSPFYKIRALLEYTFLLNAIVLKPEVIDRLGNGFAFEVEVLLREEELKEMYANNYVSLRVAREKIENRHMEQDHFMTQKYADIHSLPYTADALEENRIESPHFRFKNRRTYMNDWNLFLEEIDIGLKNREILSLQSAKSGVKVLGVAKRRQADHFLQERVNMVEYSQSIQRSKNQIQSAIKDAAPSLTTAREKWKKIHRKYKKKMELLVKSLPTKNVIFTSCLIAFASIFIPYLSNTLHSNDPFSNFLKNFLIPGVLLCLLLFISLITYKAIFKPIKLLTEETNSIIKSLTDEQMRSHSQYNEYLNNIYKLFRIRNQYRELEEKLVQQKEVNILYRWHQGEIMNHLTLLKQLMDSLAIEVQFDNKEKCLSFFNTSFNVKKNVQQNPIYSPLDCQFDKVAHGHSMDVYVENSRDEITTWTLNPIEKIRFSQDKVYSL